MINPYKQNSLINLKKARGLIEHILKMIEEDKYCIDIAQQVNASMGLLRKTNDYIIESHLLTCSTKKLLSNDERIKKEFVAELVRACSVANR